MIRSRVVLLTAAVSLAASAEPWAPYNADTERQKQVALAADKKIDFLTPSAGPNAKPRSNCLVTYDAFPPFSSGNHWCVSQVGPKYLIEAWIGSTPSPRTTLATKHWKRELPTDIAMDTKEIWFNAILQAHYPRHYLGGADGTIFYFGAKLRDSEPLGAKTWSPEGELPPAWITQAGMVLMNYAQSDSASVDALRAQLLAIRNRLFAYYREHGGQ